MLEEDIREDLILLGERVEIITGNNRVYISKVEDLIKDGVFLVNVPTLGGQPVPLYVGDRVDVGFYRETGRYATTMEVMAFENIDEVRFVWLQQKTEPHRQQRRDAYRLPIMLKVKVCEYKEGMEKDLPIFGETAEQGTVDEVKTRDISIGGVAIATKREYGAGEKYLLKVFLDDQQKNSDPLLVCAEVIRASQPHDEKVGDIGLRFHAATNNRSEVLSKYVFNQQQKQIKKRRPGGRG